MADSPDHYDARVDLPGIGTLTITMPITYVERSTPAPPRWEEGPDAARHNARVGQESSLLAWGEHLVAARGEGGGEGK